MKIIKSFAEFAEAHDAGEKFEHKYESGWGPAHYIRGGYSLRSIISKIESGVVRIKQKPQEVDMTPFIVNGLDCEFSDEQGYKVTGTRISKLRSCQRGYVAICSPNEYLYCRPRLNHTFLWSEHIELPEGLVLGYGWPDHKGGISWETEISKHTKNPPTVAYISGAKEGYCFAGEDK